MKGIMNWGKRGLPHAFVAKKWSLTPFYDISNKLGDSNRRKLSAPIILISLLFFTMPAYAVDYIFPPKQPGGCSNQPPGSGNYSCGALTLAAGDTISIQGAKPATITFGGAFVTGAGSFINAGGNTSDLNLVVDGHVAIGAGSLVNANVKTLSVGYVSIGKDSWISGSVSTQTGYVSIGAATIPPPLPPTPQKTGIGGNINTVTGYVTLGADAEVGGNISTDTGYITLEANAQVDGSITTSAGVGVVGAGYVSLGAGAKVDGSVATLGAGYVSLGADAQVGGSIAASGTGPGDYVSLGVKAIVGHGISTAGSYVSVGADGQVGGNISAKIGYVSVDDRGTVCGQISTEITPNYISIGKAGQVYGTCCNGTNSSCVANNSGITPVPLVCPGPALILSDILGNIGTTAAVAVSNVNLRLGDNYSYASSYNYDKWSGDLQAYAVDLTTGMPSATGLWRPSARDKLNQQAIRYIATFSSGGGVPFSWSNLSVVQRSSLNTPVKPPGKNDGEKVLSFLRGDRSLEGVDYRARSHILGDIINASPVFVREPISYYGDKGYAAYKTKYTTRTKMVYQASNDGMLHAFDAKDGAELWAYVPGLLFGSSLSPTFPDTSLLVGLSMKRVIEHPYLVDGTPTHGDVDFSNTGINTKVGNLTPDWRALLVGGLRKGGRGYYALDVTQPVIETELDVAAKALWEFPTSATLSPENIGNSFGKPVIAKTAATGWVVFVTSGHNNGTNLGDSGGDGQGRLYILNAKTGKVIKAMSTGVGSPTSPSGLSQISGWVDNGAVDNTVKSIYGADLQGNVWRFDVSASNPDDWRVVLLAKLVDGSGIPQPVTTAPEMALVNNKRMIYIGTGKYLDRSDLTTTQTQTMYALVDDLSLPLTGAAVISPLRSQLLQQVFSGSGNTKTLSANLILSTQKGWYADLTIPGERIATDPAIANATLVFTTVVPGVATTTTKCLRGGQSWIYAVNYVNGNQVEGSTWAGRPLEGGTVSQPILFKKPDGTILSLGPLTGGTPVPVKKNTRVARRISWRVISK